MDLQQVSSPRRYRVSDAEPMAVSAMLEEFKAINDERHEDVNTITLKPDSKH